jgi:hypothetical protein
MSERDKTGDPEAEVVIKCIDATLVFVSAWTLWKSTHDVDALEMNCCEASTMLHRSANTLEKSVKQLVMNRQFLERVFGQDIATVIEREAELILKAQALKDSQKSSKH